MQLGASSHSADEANFEKMTSAYNACLDESTIKRLGISPLLDVIRRLKKSFPAEADTARRSDRAISDAILFLAKYGISALVSPGTGADDADPDVVVVSVSPPWSIGLPSKERYEDADLVKKYQGVVVEILHQLSPEHDYKTVKGVVDLEKKLAAASPSTEEREDVTVCLLLETEVNPLANRSAEIL